MAKSPRKTKQKPNNTINSGLTNNETPPKSKQEINNSYYQKNKEKLKSQRRDKYQQDKEAEKTKRKQRYEKEKQQSQLAKQQSAQYYEAESIKVLMSLKEYTELNQVKYKLWADFCWTLKDCQKGISDIVFIMKLRESAENLINDYWKTAKNEVKKGKNHWNSLSEKQEQKLIKYWAKEKTRKENSYLTIAEQLEIQSQEYLKDIEIAKFHEERGKIKCDCWQCEQQKQIKAKVKAEQKRIIKDLEAEQETEAEFVKGECANCFEVKKVDSDSGFCKKCATEEREVENV
ncbi:MAG: hypothetical protein MRECE_2c089 [Mycoplasmataceae bacterium CE_OT135]|nr:MAG: hypothetical protein MRECE_2c089 [Mycoplasmataceae bacterium CE_OT135]